MQVISGAIQTQMAGSSWIRRMFEKGIELKKQFGADNVCDFSLGNPDIPPPPCAADALHGLAERVAQPFGMGYCPNAGLPEFREALAAHLSVQQQTAVQAAQVVVTCGAAGALTTKAAPLLLARAISDPDRLDRGMGVEDGGSVNGAPRARGRAFRSESLPVLSVRQLHGRLPDREAW